MVREPDQRRRLCIPGHSEHSLQLLECRYWEGADEGDVSQGEYMRIYLSPLIHALQMQGISNSSMIPNAYNCLGARSVRSSELPTPIAVVD